MFRLSVFVVSSYGFFLSFLFLLSLIVFSTVVFYKYIGDLVGRVKFLGVLGYGGDGGGGWVYSFIIYKNAFKWSFRK